MIKVVLSLCMLFSTHFSNVYVVKIVGCAVFKLI